jgi:hypothetical protein
MLFGKKTEKYTDEELKQVQRLEKLREDSKAGKVTVSDDLRDLAGTFEVLKLLKKSDEQDEAKLEMTYSRDAVTLRELLSPSNAVGVPSPVLARPSPGDDSGSGLTPHGTSKKRCAQLEVISGDDAQVVNIEKKQIIIGRINSIPEQKSFTPDVTLTSKYISKRHARIFFKGNDYYIVDLDSANGAYVNGKPVRSRVKLADGDEIRLGNVVIKFALTNE